MTSGERETILLTAKDLCSTARELRAQRHPLSAAPPPDSSNVLQKTWETGVQMRLLAARLRRQSQELRAQVRETRAQMQAEIDLSRLKRRAWGTLKAVTKTIK